MSVPKETASRFSSLLFYDKKGRLKYQRYVKCWGFGFMFSFRAKENKQNEQWKKGNRKEAGQGLGK